MKCIGNKNLSVVLWAFTRWGMSCVLVYICLGWGNRLAAQSSHELSIYFLYGSKPAPGFEKTESKVFGGIHGGHVSIGIDSMHISFHHVKGYHVFPKKGHLMGTFEKNAMHDFLKDTASNKYAVVKLPMDSDQYFRLTALVNRYLQKTPYDYAFFGMRCSAATYDMLSHSGYLKPRSKSGMVVGYFYPRLLRKKIMSMAKQKKYPVRVQAGRISRTWEKD